MQGNKDLLDAKEKELEEEVEDFCNDHIRQHWGDAYKNCYDKLRKYVATLELPEYDFLVAPSLKEARQEVATLN